MECLTISTSSKDNIQNKEFDVVAPLCGLNGDVNEHLRKARETSREGKYWVPDGNVLELTSVCGCSYMKRFLCARALDRANSPSNSPPRKKKRVSFSSTIRSLSPIYPVSEQLGSSQSDDEKTYFDSDQASTQIDNDMSSQSNDENTSLDSDKTSTEIYYEMQTPSSQQEVLLLDEDTVDYVNQSSDTWSLSSDTLAQCSRGDYERILSEKNPKRAEQDSDTWSFSSEESIVIQGGRSWAPQCSPQEDNKSIDEEYKEEKERDAEENERDEEEIERDEEENKLSQQVVKDEDRVVHFVRTQFSPESADATLKYLKSRSSLVDNEMDDHVESETHDH